MENKKQLSPETIYELVAYAGFRKYFHVGGLGATKELIELCHIDKNKYVLDIGCGTGKLLATSPNVMAVKWSA